MMRILMLHNRYRQPGGEDVSTAAEAALLREYGHEVSLVELSNTDASGARLALESVGIGDHSDFARHLIERDRPDVIHFQNVWPRWGPSVLQRARKTGVPTVAAIRNYRSFCPAGTAYRDGRFCADCASKPWSGVRHSCYRGSRAQSALAMASMRLHDWSGVHLIAVSSFLKKALVDAGVAPTKQISVKPNVVHPDPCVGMGDHGKPLFVYAGRLNVGKGVRTLLRAWKRLGPYAPPLDVIGAGPLEKEVVSTGDPVRHLGQLSHRDMLDRIGRATALIQPAEWPEPFGRTAIEALAKGTPTIVARNGGLPETIPTMMFTPGDADDLADAVRRMVRDPKGSLQRRREARNRYLNHFSGAAQHEQLMEIYAAAGARQQPPRSSARETAA